MASDMGRDVHDLKAIAGRAAARALGRFPVVESSERARSTGASDSDSVVAPSEASGSGSDSGFDQSRDLVGESLVRAAPEGSELVIPPGSRITPLARDLAFQRGVTFVTGRTAEPRGPLQGPAGASPGSFSPRTPSLRIALASDHGGFGLKDALVPLLRELGHRPADLGPAAGTPSVDYPDFAKRAAVEVAQGRADVGIVVDGAGIGSAMVANKVPGVLAANAWDERSARNAREHNHANVLTLGSGHLDLAKARAIVAAFLGTAVGQDRHARRAEKTRAIEAEFWLRPVPDRIFDEGR